MRSLAPVALIGSCLLVTAGQAQTLAEHAAAASGATIGTAAGKPISNAITKIFGQTDNSTKKAASATLSKTSTKTETESTPVIPPAAPGVSVGDSASSGPVGESTPSRHGGFARHSAARQYAPINPPAPVEIIQPPPRREPTAEELASIHVGASEQELVSALGQPESKVTIPDDGHLVEICQYWSNGKQLGTVRLDNGQVVNVESRTQN
jgi:hypothetical protein